MPANSGWKPKELTLALFAFTFVLFVHGAVPFFMLPTLGQAVWTTGFSLSMANGSLFNIYANDFGIPKPAAIPFGLAGAFPVSLLIRLGLHAADAYAAIAALWLGLAMFSAYRIARQFGGTNSIALAGAVIWMTMPIIWAHAEYSMLSLGISLLSFYFLSFFKLFPIEDEKIKTTPSSIVLYPIATIISVFMDGYTFMMFATGSSILIIYSLLTRPDIRNNLLKFFVPIHVISFSLAYTLYCLYIGRLNFETHTLDFFRGWGLDLSFFAIPTKGVLWLPDLLGASIKRSDERYFGDESVWATTFALPVLIFGLLSWLHVKHLTKISTGILLVSVFGFYMALGPSVKINSVKPVALQLTRPGPQSATMASDYAVAPTGNAWISESFPGFNVMRASYRWLALSVFTFWLLILIWMTKANKKEVKFLLAPLSFLFLLNLPDYENKWNNGIDNRIMFQQIEQKLVKELNKKIRPNETVAFLPWRNDFIVNYLAPKVGFRTFNIGGDKNLSAAQSHWPQEMLFLGDEIDSVKANSSLKMLIDGNADVLVITNFHMLWSSHLWPCVEETTARLTEERRASLRKIAGFLCPPERRSELQPVITALRAYPYVEIVETDLFTTIRLRSEFTDPANRIALLSGIVRSIRFPISITPDSAEAHYILQYGWHKLETHHVWSKSEAKLLLPVPKHCENDKCGIKLVFGVFGASPNRPVDVFFNSAEQERGFSEKVTAVSGDPMAFSFPLVGGVKLRSINIAIPTATSPKNLIGAPDDRILGISLERLEITMP